LAQDVVGFFAASSALFNHAQLLTQLPHRCAIASAHRVPNLAIRNALTDTNIHKNSFNALQVDCSEKMKFDEVDCNAIENCLQLKN
jgi:hypothetical protein